REGGGRAPVGWPATSNRSFAAKVRPASGPFGLPSMRTALPGTNAFTRSVMTFSSARASFAAAVDPVGGEACRAFAASGRSSALILIARSILAPCHGDDPLELAPEVRSIERPPD